MALVNDLILYISQSVFLCLPLKKFALDGATPPRPTALHIVQWVNK